MANKFKIGDRVVRVNCEHYPHERGVIVDTLPKQMLYDVQLDSGEKPQFWHFDKTEVEIVFDSPLMKALG